MGSLLINLKSEEDFYLGKAIMKAKKGNFVDGKGVIKLLKEKAKGKKIICS